MTKDSQVLFLIHFLASQFVEQEGKTQREEGGAVRESKKSETCMQSTKHITVYLQRDKIAQNNLKREKKKIYNVRKKEGNECMKEEQMNKSRK